MMPQFIVDLPGGGGKRLMTSYDEYDRSTGVSTYRAPGLFGEKGSTLYKYYDPSPVPPTEHIVAAPRSHNIVGESAVFGANFSDYSAPKGQYNEHVAQAMCG